MDMSYLVDIYSPTGDAIVQDSLYSPSITVRGWSKRINAAGKFVFSIHRNHAAATDETLRMWRHVRLYRTPRDGSGMEEAWYGMIISKRQVGEYIEVLCHGGLRIFDKRYTTGTFTGQGSTEAFSLVTTTNGTDGETGIGTGTGGVTTTMNITLDGVTISRALEEFAMATGAEYEVDDGGLLNFVPSLGTDKSELIELIFRMDGEKGTNLIEFEIAEDGEPMANKVIGTTNGGGGLTYTFTHPSSTPDYPVLIERKVFNNANNQGTLDALTEAYAMQRGLPIPDFRSVPATATKKFNQISGTRVLSGIDYSDVSVGDLVLVTLITPNRNESVVKRIAEIAVDVDENLNEQIRYTLTESGVFVTESYLNDTAFQDVKQRIQLIESQL